MAKRGFISVFFYKHIFIVALVFAVIIGCGLYIFYFSDKIQTIKELRSGKHQSDVLQKKALELSLLKNFNANYQGIDKHIIEKVNDLLPFGVQLPELYTQLESLAQENGVTVLNVSVTALDNNVVDESKFSFYSNLTKTVKKIKVADAKVLRSFDLKRMQLILKIGGSDKYSSLKNFVTAVQNNVRLMDITSIEFDPRSEQYNIHLTTYYLEKKIANKKK